MTTSHASTSVMVAVVAVDRGDVHSSTAAPSDSCVNVFDSWFEQYFFSPSPPPCWTPRARLIWRPVTLEGVCSSFESGRFGPVTAGRL